MPLKLSKACSTVTPKPSSASPMFCKLHLLLTLSDIESIDVNDNVFEIVIDIVDCIWLKCNRFQHNCLNHHLTASATQSMTWRTV